MSGAVETHETKTQSSRCHCSDGTTTAVQSQRHFRRWHDSKSDRPRNLIAEIVVVNGGGLATGMDARNTRDRSAVAGVGVLALCMAASLRTILGPCMNMSATKNCSGPVSCRPCCTQSWLLTRFRSPSTRQTRTSLLSKSKPRNGNGRCSSTWRVRSLVAPLLHTDRFAVQVLDR
jgi:hypothetical protein